MIKAYIDKLNFDWDRENPTSDVSLISLTVVRQKRTVHQYLFHQQHLVNNLVIQEKKENYCSV